jgi:hypothetical protein
LKGKPFV